MIKLLFFFILAICFLIVPLYLVHLVCKPNKYTMEQTKEIEQSKGFLDHYELYETEDFPIQSFDGYKLNGSLLFGESKEKFVILTHGYTYTRYGSMKYAHLFLNLGYSVYVYDLRHHGANKEFFCSMGDYESRDIVAIAAAIKERFGPSVQIGLHGESLGAASSILASALSPDFSFLIEDCGFSDLKSLLIYQGKSRFHLPKFEVSVASFYNKILHKTWYGSISPIHALQNATLPVLMIHGKEDDFIPPSMCEDMYAKYHGVKQMVLFDGAKHAASYETNPVKYKQVVESFLANLN